VSVGAGQVKAASAVMDRYENELIAERRAAAAENGGDLGSDHLGKLLAGQACLASPWRAGCCGWSLLRDQLGTA